MEAERVLNDLYKKINETGCEGRLPVAIFRVEKNILTYSGWKWRFVPNSGIYEIAVMAQKMSLAEFEERYYKYCSAGYTVKEMAKMFNMSVSSAYRYRSKLKRLK